PLATRTGGFGTSRIGGAGRPAGRGVAQTPKPLGHGSYGMARRHRPAGGRPGRAKPGLCRAECGARWVAQGQREGG
ncbi:hypothetical protein ABTK49_20030, partial [Acinetobacter baumannii]